MFVTSFLIYNVIGFISSDGFWNMNNFSKNIRGEKMRSGTESIYLNKWLLIHSLLVLSSSPHNTKSLFTLPHLEPSLFHSELFPGFLHLFYVSYCLILLILYSSFQFHIFTFTIIGRVDTKNRRENLCKPHFIFNLISIIWSAYYFATCIFRLYLFCRDLSLRLNSMLWSNVYVTGCQARWMITGRHGLCTINFLPSFTFVNI